MRNSPNEPATVATDADPDVPAHVPERRCILTGEHGPRAELIRLALAPDGTLLPDLAAKAPGRGAWIGVDRTALQTALAKGKLRGALARAFKGVAVQVPADLPDLIEAGLKRRALERLGLEMRAGHIILGSERIGETARAGGVALLLHAGDASADGRGKLDQRWRVGGGEAMGIVLPASRDDLSAALGRGNVVHVAVSNEAAARRVQAAIDRWLAFCGTDGDDRRGATAAADDVGYRDQA